MNFISQCFYIIIEIPLTFLRDITIPQCEEENWNQNYVTIMPFTCLLFILAVLNSFVEYFTNPILICCTLIPAICLCVLIRCTTYRGKLPKWILVYLTNNQIVAIVGFIMSIFWIYMTANMIVDIISTFGVMFDIPTNFLALTVLAFANSIGGNLLFFKSQNCFQISVLLGQDMERWQHLDVSLDRFSIICSEWDFL